jgi:hypothetical protein
VQAFAYLSVLVSIIIGLGMAHVLAAAVRLIQHRARVRFYWPALAWALNLFGLMLLVWWAEYSLNHHDRWTFAQFAVTVAIPVLLYVAASLVLPAGNDEGKVDLRVAYQFNRVWFLSLVAASILASYLQTYLFDGRIPFDLDNGLKLLALGITSAAIVVRNEAVQKMVAAVNLAWLLLYISVLFVNLREA